MNGHMANGGRPVTPPSVLLTASEMLRSPLEALSLLILGWQRLPRGDGHTVLVLPGFFTDDASTLLLRSFLEDLGYSVHGWDLGWNLDHHTTGMDGEHVARRLHHISDSTERSVSLVGWSLGGLIAREAAKRHPGAVRQVITLGSPLGGNPEANRLRLLYERLTGNELEHEVTRSRFSSGNAACGVPSTSIYSRTDGIIPWENTQLKPHSLNENVEVNSSHFGLVANPEVFHIIADRLSQSEGNWEPYASRKKRTDA